MTRVGAKILDDAATLGAIGVAAYLLADVAHEAIGHGLACLAHPEQIALLTSVYFRCSIRSPLVAVAGPAVNLVLAAVFGTGIGRIQPMNSGWRLFGFLTTAFNLFWGAGSMVYHSLSNQDDWAIGVAGLEPAIVWRGGLVVVGSGLYYLGVGHVVRVMRSSSTAIGRTRRLVLIPYVISGAAACAAAALYRPHPLAAIREGFLEAYAANAGLLAAALPWWSSAPSAALPPITRSVGWVAAGGLAFVIFALLLGRGLP